MKRCPTCQRNYPDNKQLFCLEDGATLVLIADNDPFSPHTRPIREPRDTTPAATEVLTTPIYIPPPAPTLVTPTAPARAVLPPPTYMPPTPPASPRAGLLLGLSALALAALALIFMVAGFAVVSSNSDLGGGLIVITMPLSLLGTVLGLVGVVRAVRNASSRVWPILGFVANVLYLLFILAVLVLGIAVSK